MLPFGFPRLSDRCESGDVADSRLGDDLAKGRLARSSEVGVTPFGRAKKAPIDRRMTIAIRQIVFRRRFSILSRSIGAFVFLSHFCLKRTSRICLWKLIIKLKRETNLNSSKKNFAFYLGSLSWIGQLDMVRHCVRGC